MAFNTGNAPGSTDPRDLSDSSGDIDEWATSKTKLMHPDRLGVSRLTWYGMEQKLNEILVAGGKIFATVEQGRAAAQDGQFYLTAGVSERASIAVWERLSSTESRLVTEEYSAEMIDVEAFLSRGTVSANTLLGNVQRPGTYFLAPNSNYNGVPNDYNQSLSYWLFVESLGNSQGIGEGRYISQEIRAFIPEGGEYLQSWLRRYDKDNGASSDNKWIPGIRRDGDYYAQRGNLPAESTTGAASLPGTYTLLPNSNYRGLPEGYDQNLSYFLFVDASGPTNGSGFGSTRFAFQTLTELLPTAGRVRKKWQRRMDRDDPENTTGFNAWEEVKPPLNPVVQYLGRGLISAATNFAEVTEPGFRLALPNAEHTGLPDDLDPASAFYFEVKDYELYPSEQSGRFIYQKVTENVPGNHGGTEVFRRSWERRLDQNNPGSVGSASMWTPVVPRQIGGGSSSFADNTIVCFGDSITEGNSTFKWPPILEALTGATVINGGFGGCRMAIHDNDTPTPNDSGLTYGEAYDPMCMHSLSDRVANDSWNVLTDAAQVLFDAVGDDNRPQAAALAELDWSTVDYAVIFYGTNDFRGTSNMGVPIGNDTDTTRNTFKGAINRTINNICSARPGIKLLFVTPLWRSRVSTSGEDSNLTPNASGVFLREYAEAIIDRAEAHQIPVLDLNTECGINILNWEYYTPDGLHPYSAPGMDLVARKIYAGLSRYY